MEPEIEKSTVWGTSTRWTVVLSAANRQSTEESENAWRYLVERYRQPVMLAIQRRLPASLEADEVADDFFTYVFEKSILMKADADVGRFRCYLQGVLRRFVLHYLRTEGPRAVGSIEHDLLAQVENPALESQEDSDWALAFLCRASDQLLSDHPRDGALLLHTYGVCEHPKIGSKELCQQHGMNSSALYVALHRARKRLRQCLEEEIKQTVATPQELEGEVDFVASQIGASSPGLLVTP